MASLVLKIGQQSRSFSWGRAEVAALSRMLGKDYFAYAVDEGSFENFASAALLVGMGQKAKRNKITQLTILKWMDQDILDEHGKVLSDDEVMEAILYAIARGKPAAEAKKQVALLDQILKGHPEVPEDAPDEDLGPLADLSVDITSESTE